jgi:hypothetical protein
MPQELENLELVLDWVLLLLLLSSVPARHQYLTGQPMV